MSGNNALKVNGLLTVVHKDRFGTPTGLLHPDQLPTVLLRMFLDLLFRNPLRSLMDIHPINLVFTLLLGPNPDIVQFHVHPEV